MPQPKRNGTTPEQAYSEPSNGDIFDLIDMRTRHYGSYSKDTAGEIHSLSDLIWFFGLLFLLLWFYGKARA